MKQPDRNIYNTQERAEAMVRERIQQGDTNSLFEAAMQVIVNILDGDYD